MILEIERWQHLCKEHQWPETRQLEILRGFVLSEGLLERLGTFAQEQADLTQQDFGPVDIPTLKKKRYDVYDDPEDGMFQWTIRVGHLTRKVGPHRYESAELAWLSAHVHAHRTGNINLPDMA